MLSFLVHKIFTFYIKGAQTNLCMSHSDKSLKTPSQQKSRSCSHNRSWRYIKCPTSGETMNLKVFLHRPKLETSDIVYSWSITCEKPDFYLKEMFKIVIGWDTIISILCVYDEKWWYVSGTNELHSTAQWLLIQFLWLREHHWLSAPCTCEYYGHYNCILPMRLIMHCCGRSSISCLRE
jgi:hypothetical protein